MGMEISATKAVLICMKTKTWINSNVHLQVNDKENVGGEAL